jgi:predicted transglutaminase-like cysteine proteinase
MHDHRVISPWHAGTVACFILVLVASFGKPTSPFASGIWAATPSATVTTPGYPAVRTNTRFAFARPAKLKIPSATRSEPFGLDSVEVTSGWLLNTWRGVQNDIRADSKILKRCRARAEDCPPAAKTFLAIITVGRAHTGRASIGVINRAINLAIRAKSDPTWMGPLATLSKGSGDCKDYAIAKYVALREVGIAEQDLRLVIVHDLALDEDHAIVTARLGQNWLVLDNRWLTLARDADLRRVVPLFVLDHDGLRQFLHEKTYSNSVMPFGNVAPIRSGSRIS